MERIKTFNYDCDPILQKLDLEANGKCEDLFKRDYHKVYIYFPRGGILLFQPPSACHVARFMVDSIYILVLHLTSVFISQLNEDSKPKFEYGQNTSQYFMGYISSKHQSQKSHHT